MDATPADRLRIAVARIAELTHGRAATGVMHDDADETVGSIESDDAVGFDPLPVLKAIAQAGAPAVVIGQVAGILHGSIEATGDLDLLWSGDGPDAEAMVAAFTTLRAELFDESSHPLHDPREAFALPEVLFRTSSAAGDCCTPRLPWVEHSWAEPSPVTSTAPWFATLPSTTSSRCDERSRVPRICVGSRSSKN